MSSATLDTEYAALLDRPDGPLDREGDFVFNGIVHTVYPWLAWRMIWVLWNAEFNTAGFALLRDVVWEDSRPGMKHLRIIADGVNEFFAEHGMPYRVAIKKRYPLSKDALVRLETDEKTPWRVNLANINSYNY